MRIAYRNASPQYRRSILAEWSIHLTISKYTDIARSAIPFCSGVYGTVVSKIIPMRWQNESTRFLVNSVPLSHLIHSNNFLDCLFSIATVSFKAVAASSFDWSSWPTGNWHETSTVTKAYCISVQVSTDIGPARSTTMRPIFSYLVVLTSGNGK